MTRGLRGVIARLGALLGRARRDGSAATLPAGHPASGESEKRFRTLLDLAPDAVLVHQDDRIVYCNAAAVRLYGAADERQLLGRNVFDIVHPDERETIARRIQGILDGVPTPLREFRHVRLDGAALSVETTGAPVSWEGRRAAQVFVRDIAQRKAAEEAMRQSESRFRGLAEAMPQIVWSADASGAIDYYNLRAYQYCGVTPGDIEGWRWTRVIHPDDLRATGGVWQSAIETGDSYAFEQRLLRADGQFRWHLTRGVPIRDDDGRVVRWIGTATDIHDQKLAESKYETILQTTRSGFWLFDLEGRLLEVNDAYCQMSGYSRAELLRMRISDLDADETESDVLARIDLIRRQGGLQFEARHRRKDGTVFDVDIRCTALDIEGGRLVTFVWDITDRKRAEDALKQSAKDLAQANRVKDEFLATLSHELRTPLNAILGWSQMLLQGRVDQARLTHALEVIDRNAQTQVRLIDEVLDVSRIINGKLLLDVRPTDVMESLVAALDAVRPAAAAKGIDIVPSISDSPQVLGDPDRLQQVLWNLLSNAVKFTPRGGRVDVTVRAADGHAEIEVRDNGIGLSSDALPHMFERFWQADRSTTRQYAGLGLGLAIVRHLVELHGGQVRAESPGTGRGATFTVALPVSTHDVSQPERQAATSRPLERAVPAMVPSLTGIRVLVVDDEPDARDVLDALLREQGAEVNAVAGAREGLRAVAEWSPHVILCDIAMPEVDGYEFARQLRALPAEKGGAIPAAALTAYGHADDRQRALDAGFQRHVPKPVTPADLAVAVASLAQPSAPAL